MEWEEPSVYKKVDSIVFGIFSPKMIKKMAAAKIVTPELYDKEGYPVDGGLMDTRLGVIDPGLKCRTCGSKLKECFGHFGYIELARPIIHIKFIALILNLLKCTCRECGKILYPKEKLDSILEDIEDGDIESSITDRKKIVKGMITNLKTVSKCPHCKARQYKINLEKPSTFMENDKRLTPIEARIRLEKVSDEDCEALGLNPKFVRPEWLILTILSIPPVTMRPTITLESGERSEDDLTHKLGDIVRINQRLFENINAGAPEIIIEDLWDLLQYHITTFFDNNIAQIPPARHRSGQPLKTITERIKSKEGRIRHNLAGKRTNFSARTVISPDPLLGLNEVGVPQEIAMKLTVPERVTEWNIEYLKEFVEKGPKVYPGSNYIVRPDGKKKKITDDTKEAFLEELQPGYQVERHLKDGDVAIFNRQPSLHRMSMMCHKVRVLPGKTFRLNPAVCAPYNADFDGDEMNLHVPQTEESRAEAEYLLQVQTQIISPRYGLSIIGCNQDAITGNYLLTNGMEMPYDEAVDLLSLAGEDTFSLPKKDTVTGKQVVSCILPKDFNFVGHSKSCRKCKECKREKCETDSYIHIKNGNLKTGVLDKANLGEGSGFLLRDLHKKYGADVTIELIGKLFRLGIMVLMKRGFSISLADLDLPDEAENKINKIIADSNSKIEELIKDYHEKRMDALPGRSIEETLELRILEILNKARNDAGQVVLEFGKEDSQTSVMVHSGARGNIINLAQMSAVVGQQALRGRRIDFGYKGRTLSCFNKGDLSPDARGFISSSFRSGLKPHEFFFGAMTGRDSLMDTALRTPKSGYLYRRLANAMQDVKVEYDETVRDASKKIIQFTYGEDGIDVSKSENGSVNIKKIIEEISES